jgi:hypothetical protein
LKAAYVFDWLLLSGAAAVPAAAVRLVTLVSLLRISRGVHQDPVVYSSNKVVTSRMIFIGAERLIHHSWKKWEFDGQKFMISF